MLRWLSITTFALLLACGEKPNPSKIFSNFHTDHHRSLHHQHSFHHHDTETGEFAKIKYNATKCSRKDYVVLDDITKVRCFGADRIICEFHSHDKQQQFLALAKPAKILISHRKIPCFETGEGVLLQIQRCSAHGNLEVEVHGSSVQPFEVFEHLDAELTTNMLFFHQSEHGCGYARNRMLPTSTDQEVSIEQTDYETQAHIGPWKIPLPSDVLWQDPSAARMFCIDCGMHFFPVLKFKIRIANYRLEEFLLVYESTTVLDIEPHVSFDARSSGQSMELYKDYLEQLLEQFRVTLYVGGIPIEISPGVRLGLFMFSTANVEAHVGYKETLFGSFKGGLEYHPTKGLEKIASSHFDSTPENYKLLLGKKCKLYSKPRVESVSDISACAKLCDKYLGCRYFSYGADTGVCRLSRECEQEINTSTDELVFESSKWNFPQPNPELKGIISFGFMPEIYLKINRIGGPNLALCIAQTLQLFSYNIESQCSISRIDTKVSYLLGGNIHLKVGQATVLKMEEYLQPMYTQKLPITGAFQICPKVKLPEVNLPLPWISEASTAPKSLDDAITRSRKLSTELKNCTNLSYWKNGSLESTLRQIQGLPSPRSNRLSDRITGFIESLFSWVRKKVSAA